MQVSTCWTESLDLTQSVLLLRDLALRHARESGPYSESLLKILNQDPKKLLEYELDYGVGAKPHHVIHARQVLGFFQKLEPLGSHDEQKRCAVEKFEESERMCKSTNELFRALRHGNLMFPAPDWQLLLAARRKIRVVLGSCPSLASLRMRFGPGATTAIKRSYANPVTKMASGLQCSADVLASGLLPSVLREVPHWSDAHTTGWWIDEEGWLGADVPVVIEPGRVTFVPKNAKTFRSIVVEPNLNTFVQAGIGDAIGRRLRRIGVDIRDQTANQRAALVGSLDGSLATIDLSSASDLISTELVRFLLPADWYRLLSSFRTSTVLLEGREVALEKFSSMGNGFTFPLETLIFYCLTQAVCQDPRVLAYGDDIICPSTCFSAVAHLLELCGFVLNRSKSFSDGPFRESCGHDYYFGINVRPFYQKRLVSGQSLFTLHNFYTRRNDVDSALYVRGLIPRPLRIFGPDGYGDGHLVSEEWKRVRKSADLRRGYMGAYFETYAANPRTWINIYPGDWVSPLYSIYSRALVPLAGAEDWDLTEPVSSCDTSRQRVSWPLPGDDGYKKTLVYTLAP